jgi:hypothetical protein
LAPTSRHHLQYDGDRKLFCESGVSPQRHSETRPRPRVPSLRERPEQQLGPDYSQSSLTSAPQVSPGSSQIEKMLQNIDHKFVSEAPFLIEDQLKD